MRDHWKEYSLAAVVSAASVAVTRLTWPFFAPAPFAPVFGAVAAATQWGSGRAGLLATALSALGLALLFPGSPPFAWTSPALYVFIAIAVGSSRVIAGRNRAVAALRAREAELRATLEQMRASEEQLRQAHKMKAVGQLAAGVAHNFNNLLQVTMGYTDVLLDEASSDDQRTAIEEIRRATERGATLTRQLITFGRRHDARPQRIDLDATIAGLRDMLTRVVREDIDLTMALASGAAVMIDVSDLEQVIINLAINARDALPDGGAIQIETARSDGLVCLRVRDNGAGMTPDVQARLFEPFFTTKEVGEGTGLGLAFVHGVAQHAGGHVSVQSAPGAGTTVSVHLPVVAAAAEPPPPVRPAATLAHARRAATILLVEDESAVRATTERILKRAGYGVVSAATPAAARELFERQGSSIDLLLTDIVMPGMHGPELADHLRATRPSLPVVFVSGYSDVMPLTTPAGPRAAFVAKPFAAADLIGAVERLLDGQQRDSSSP